MSNLGKIFKNGIIDENPTFVQVIGMCPTLAVTSSAINGIGMGLSTAVVLACSNLAISLLRKIVPDKIRIPCFVVVIATFVTIVQMLLKAYVPALDKALGLYIPLIVVNCLILARAESFASKNSVFSSMIDGIGQGVGFTFALIVLSSVREILGNGTWLGFPILGKNYVSIGVITQAPGAFIILGLLVAGFNMLSKRVSAKKEGGN